jgi:uncharacterized protein (TIGR02757 family)
MRKKEALIDRHLKEWLEPTINLKQQAELKSLLDPLVDYYQQPAFIRPDPISVPWGFAGKQDKEIMGLFAALFAWGRRDITLGKCAELIALLDNQPFDFVMSHQAKELERMSQFKHRTFMSEDIIYFLTWFRWFYNQHESLEHAFLVDGKANYYHVGLGISTFHELFFSLASAPRRTRKHISTPVSHSACKRICMFLRWMVRSDRTSSNDKTAGNSVDFGIWTQIRPDQLICPLDVHVMRNAQELGLLDTDKSTWQAAVQLTSNLRLLDPIDPVRYDFALFGLGVNGGVLG